MDYRRNMRGLVFKYEAAWELKEDCHRIMTESWKKGHLGGIEASSMRHKLKLCQRDLVQWKQKNKEYDKRDTTQRLARISQLQNTGTGHHLDTMKQLQKEVELSLAEKNMIWRQRAKQRWLKHGDKNT
ncbi:uncharacterized protein LOC122304498 [Carya illinoinensis]|uniref:uncharacterized protein LOC122304498 n=1 Tax=Carya illinoinensis TaxID=32201 RepID=UPI001C72288D|nr:uncharacterized protein LOC122304498 [Carya illinoinensis]